LSTGAKDRPFEVVTFFDPYDTVTNTKAFGFDNLPQQTQHEWLSGIRELQLLGCPDWYMIKALDFVLGLVPMQHTLSDIYVKPEARKVNERQYGGRPIDEIRMRQTQQRADAPQNPRSGVSMSNSIGSPAINPRVLASNSGVSKGQNIKHIQRLFTSDQQEYMRDVARRPSEERKLMVDKAISQLTPEQRNLIAGGARVGPQVRPGGIKK
jgi:hypothetical protein